MNSDALSLKEKWIMKESRFKIAVVDHLFDDLSIEEREFKKVDYELVAAQCKTEDAMIDLAEDADGILNHNERITGKVIRALKKCKIIVRYAIGTDNIDLRAATEKRIYVCNVPDYCVDEVSTQALALILGCARKIVRYFDIVKGGYWDVRQGKPLFRLRGKTLGLVGFGRIGQRLAEKVKPLGMRLLCCTLPPIPERAKRLGVEFTSLGNLLRESDFVSLHLPLTSETKGMFGMKELGQMKNTAFLINTSRGGIVEDEVLYTALRQGWIAGAGLDVFEGEPIEGEPLPSDIPLVHLPNVIITPHIGWYSEESVVELREKAIKEIIRVLGGSYPRSLVNPEVLRRTKLPPQAAV